MGEIAPGSVALADLTDQIEILHIAGKDAAELMREVCPEADGA